MYLTSLCSSGTSAGACRNWQCISTTAESSTLIHNGATRAAIAVLTLLVATAGLAAPGKSARSKATRAKTTTQSGVITAQRPAFLPACIPTNPEPQIAPDSETGVAAGTGLPSPQIGFAGGLQLPLQRPHIVGRLRGNKPVITEISGEFAGGKVALTGEINMAQSEGPQRATVRFDGVCLAPVLQMLGIEVEQPTDGRVCGTLNARWSGMKPDAVQRTLEGTLSLELAHGTLADTELLARLSKAAGISGLKRVDVDKGHLEAVISDGQMHITAQKLDGPQFDVSVSGQINLVTRTVDLRCQLRLAPELLSSLGGPLGLAAFVIPGPSVVQPIAVKPTTAPPPVLEKLSLPQITISGTVDNPSIQLAGEELKPQKVTHLEEPLVPGNRTSDSADRLIARQ